MQAVLEWAPEKDAAVGAFCLDDAIMALLAGGELVDIHRQINKLPSAGLGGAARGVGKLVLNEFERRVRDGGAGAPLTIADPEPAVMSEADAVALLEAYLPIVKKNDTNGLIYDGGLKTDLIDILTGESPFAHDGLLHFALAKRTTYVPLDWDETDDGALMIGDAAFCPSNPAAHVSHDPKCPRGADIVVRLPPPLADGRSLQERAAPLLPPGYEIRPKSERAMHVGTVIQTAVSGRFQGSAILRADGSSLPGALNANWRGDSEGGSDAYGWYAAALGGGEAGFPDFACAYMYMLWLIVWGRALAFPQSGNGGINFLLSGGVETDAQRNSRGGTCSP